MTQLFAAPGPDTYRVCCARGRKVVLPTHSPIQGLDVQKARCASPISPQIIQGAPVCSRTRQILLGRAFDGPGR